MIRYPKQLKKGDMIGITAPSQSANFEKIDKAIDTLKVLGFKVIETKNVRNKEQYFVSSDGKTRADEFMSLYQNPKVKHIICARGGEFLMDMIPYLHEYHNLLRIIEPVKFVQGYSDNSLLNYYLTTNYNIATMHAENINDFWMEHLEKTQLNTIDVITGKYLGKEFMQDSFEKYQLNEYEDGNFQGYHLTEEVKYQLLGSKEKSFSVQGRIIGGCIDVITQLLGTKYDKTEEFISQFPEGMIWYLDNAELSFQEFYRRLFQMREAGWFENINCLLVGRSFVKEVVNQFSLEVALQKALGKLHIPIVYDVDIGHVPPQFVIINGAKAKFEYSKGKGRLTQIFE